MRNKTGQPSNQIIMSHSLNITPNMLLLKKNQLLDGERVLIVISQLIEIVDPVDTA